MKTVNIELYYSDKRINLRVMHENREHGMVSFSSDEIFKSLCVTLECIPRANKAKFHAWVDRLCPIAEDLARVFDEKGKDEALAFLRSKLF